MDTEYPSSSPSGPSGQNPTELKFKPVTEGLGFHPFSDGLPYAPIAKKNLSGGSGALSAGAPRFVPPQSTEKPVNYQNRPSANPQLQVPTSSGATTGVAGMVAAGPAIGTTARSGTANSTAQAFELIPGRSYLLRRVCAYGLDLTIHSVVCVLAVTQVLFKHNISAEVLRDVNFLVVLVLFLGVFNWLSTTAQEVIFGTTIGKRIFRLYLKGSGIAIFLRALFFIPSVSFFGIGLLWCLWDWRKRCWHDRIVGVQPAEIQ